MFSKQVIKWISILLFILLPLSSCEDQVIKQKLSSFASDGIYNVEVNDVCYTERKGYFFVKNCSSDYYSAVVVSSDVRNKAHGFEFRHFYVFQLKKPNDFFDIHPVLSNYDNNGSTSVDFSEFPDSLIIINSSVDCHSYYKKNKNWVLHKKYKLTSF
jgi:hypothetical protein